MLVGYYAFFERRVADGERFHAGETVQIGWMLTKLEAGEDSLLCVAEPDMKAIPIKFVDSVDSTLKHLRNQKDVVESIAPIRNPDFPSLQQSAVVHIRYKSASRLFLTRNPPHETDSGWSLTDPCDEVHAQYPSPYLRISLYQLGVDRPDLIKFLAFPPGLRVRIDDLQIHVSDPKARFSRYLGRILKRWKSVAHNRSASDRYAESAVSASGAAICFVYRRFQKEFIGAVNS